MELTERQREFLMVVRGIQKERAERRVDPPYAPSDEVVRRMSGGSVNEVIIIAGALEGIGLIERRPSLNVELYRTMEDDWLL